MRITKMNTHLNDDYSVRLVKESARNYKGVDRLSNPQNIVQLMNDVFHMDSQAEEYIYLITMTIKCKPIGFFEVAHGTCGACISGVREIFIRALLSGASCIVLVHNHPSGEPDPSHEDIFLTKRIEEAANLIGIVLNDHIIIGRDTYFSFRENQYLRQDEGRGVWAGERRFEKSA